MIFPTKPPMSEAKDSEIIPNLIPVPYYRIHSEWLSMEYLHIFPHLNLKHLMKYILAVSVYLYIWTVGEASWKPIQLITLGLNL